jgi:hypothetical protein
VSNFLSQNNNKLYFFLRKLIALTEQASSRTSCLKAFFVNLISYFGTLLSLSLVSLRRFSFV